MPTPQGILIDMLSTTQMAAGSESSGLRRFSPFAPLRSVQRRLLSSHQRSTASTPGAEKIASSGDAWTGEAFSENVFRWSTAAVPVSFCCDMVHLSEANDGCRRQTSSVHPPSWF